MPRLYRRESRSPTSVVHDPAGVLEVGIAGRWERAVDRLGAPTTAFLAGALAGLLRTIADVQHAAAWIAVAAVVIVLAVAVYTVEQPRPPVPG